MPHSSAANAVAPRATVRPLSHLARPPARDRAAMAYDETTATIVLFGGNASSGAYLCDTWTWDGALWTQRRTTPAPPVRYDASMAFDAARGQVVLFGGCCLDSGDFLGDTWTWDGFTWTKREPPARPPQRGAAAMTYDALSRTVILVGGENYSDASRTGIGALADMWSWDGATWTHLVPAASPSGRSCAALAGNPALSGLMLFGGYSAPDLPEDTWLWAGGNWSQLQPATSPPPRYVPATALDSARRSVVLFGGQYRGAALGDTWLWDGRTWRQSFPRTRPGARQDASMTYDAGRRVVVLFGGINAGRRLDDTWLWDGTDWSPW